MIAKFRVVCMAVDCDWKLLSLLNAVDKASVKFGSLMRQAGARSINARMKRNGDIACDFTQFHYGISG